MRFSELPLVEEHDNFAVRDHLALEDLRDPDIGSRGQDRGILGQCEMAPLSTATPAARRGGRPRQSSPTSVAEPAVAAGQLPPRSRSSRSRAGGGDQHGAVVADVLLKLSELLTHLIRAEQADVVEHGIEVVLGLREERIEEARGACGGSRTAPALEQAARRLPTVVERLDHSWRTNGSSPPGANSSSAPASPKAIVRQPRPRASSRRAQVLRVDSASADNGVVGSTASACAARGPPSAASPLADDDRVDELDRDMAGVRARRRRVCRDARPGWTIPGKRSAIR